MLYSECAQQNGADEREHGEHGQHIEPQRKVHVTPPVPRFDLSIAERRRSSNDKHIASPKMPARTRSTLARYRQRPDIAM
jgi:hypothetical protein